MKHGLKKYFASLLVYPIMMASASLLCITLPSAAQASPVPSADIAMTLDSSDTICQGEPIVLRYKISNLSAGEKTMFTLPNGQSWVTMHITNKMGNTVSASPAPRVTEGTISTEERLDIFGYSSHEGYFVPSLLFTALSPGTYTLSVHAELSYGYPDGAIPLIKGDPGRVIRNFTFSLTITPADPSRLQSIADGLRTAIQKQPGTSLEEPKHMLFQSLLSMPDAAAASSWEVLAKDPQQSADMAREMLNLLSPKAADLMAEMAWKWKQPVDTMLYTMYAKGDEALRSQISDLYKQYSKVFPGSPESLSVQ